MRVECEGGAAAWLAGILMVPNGLGYGLPLPQELWPYQRFFFFFFFFELLVSGDEKASLASFSIAPPVQLEGSLAWGPSLLFGASGT